MTALSLHHHTFADDAGEAALMAQAARNFIAALSDGQRAKAVLAFDDANRYDWHYVPRPRRGIPFKDLDRAQSFLAQALLSSALSARGSMKINTIMSLETVLREIESLGGDARAPSRRDADLYYFTVFGEPSADSPWGWRVEGHHVSLNFTIAKGAMVSSTPAFLGSNPHEVLEGPRKGLRPLAAEEDLARDLFRSLDESQRGRALIDPTAPGDIFTANKRKAEFDGPPKGLPRASMNEEQRARLQNLLDEYIDNLHPYLAAQRRAKIKAMTPEQWDQVHFVWMGGTEKGQPHYYRVQAPAFLIEYDNIQNNANHSHTVWRDWNGDFGDDLLAEHYRTGHSSGNH